MKALILSGGILLLLVIACSSGSTPTPDLESRLEELVQADASTLLAPHPTLNRLPSEGVGTPVDIMPSADHRNVGEFISYTTTPPSSGPHWGSPEWADCGIHDAPVPDERVVHNMEHGHVIISYNLPNEADAVRMVEVAKGLPNLNGWGVVRPYSKIEEGTVGMTAWGVIDIVDGVDERRIRRFYTEYARNRLSEETAQVGPIRCTGSVS